HRVVLDPAGPRQDLLVLELVPGDLVAPVIEDHEAGAGGALVDCSDEVGHARSPPWVGSAAANVIAFGGGYPPGFGFPLDRQEPADQHFVQPGPDERAED